MALEERQTQIRERAGLEESRLNQDFVDFLRKYGSYILIAAALSVLGFSLWQRYKQAQDTKLGQAFEELEAARTGSNPNPDSLISVAQTYDSLTGVAVLARLGAADAWLDSIRRGVRPGAEVSPEGAVAAEDELGDAERMDLLNRAAGEYQWVVDRAGSSAGFDVHAMEGLYGLAAVAECKGDWEAAKGYLQRVEEKANAKGFLAHAKVARSRIESMATLAALTPVPERAAVPQPLDTTPAPVETPTQTPTQEPIAEPAKLDLSPAEPAPDALAPDAPSSEAPKTEPQSKP
jgi:hypothetical protein